MSVTTDRCFVRRSVSFDRPLLAAIFREARRIGEPWNAYVRRLLREKLNVTEPAIPAEQVYYKPASPVNHATPFYGATKRQRDNLEWMLQQMGTNNE